MKTVATALLLSLAALHSMAAQPPVYRCGNTYTQEPCAQGRIVAATDPRTAAQQAEARRVAADERRLAAEMRRDRLAEQAAQKPGAAASLGAAPLAKPVVLVERAHPKKRRGAAKPPATTDFVAVDPSSRKRRSGG